jgi:hypothetical protein
VGVYKIVEQSSPVESKVLSVTIHDEVASLENIYSNRDVYCVDSV